MNLLQHALLYAGLGWAVFPLTPGAKIPMKDSRGFLDASTDPEQIRTWWADTPRANIGLACGASDLAVIDLDTKKGAKGLESWAELCASLSLQVATYTVQTPSSGRHLYFRQCGAAIPNSAGKLGTGIDVRGVGGYVVAPPSRVFARGTYAPLSGQPDALQPFPAELAALLAPPAPPSPRRQTDPQSAPPDDAGPFWLAQALDNAAPGNRNHTAFWLACQLRDAGLSQNEAEPYLLEYAATVTRGDNPYRTSEALASLGSAYSQPRREPARSLTPAPYSAPKRPTEASRAQNRPDSPQNAMGDAAERLTEPFEAQSGDNADFVPLSDVLNGRRLAERYGRNLRYVFAWGWMAWDGKRWVRDTGGQAERYAKLVAASYYRDAAKAAEGGDKERAKQFAQHAHRSHSARAVAAMLQMARSEEALIARAEDFDADPWVLNVDNGTIDLQTGELRPHRREDYLTKLCPVTYDPAATCPTWQRFQREVADGDDELMAFKARWYGYCATGAVGEQAIVIAYGTGSNGKSTEVNTIRAVLGPDYAWHCPTETLLAKRGGGIPNDLAQLRGMRFVSAIEADAGRRLAEGLVKQLTGGDPITARFLRAEYFTFMPSHKLVLATNHKPEIWGSDHAIWRRIKLVPYTVTIPEEQQDKDLAAKLEQEAAGILAWIVRGCLAWRRGGLRVPQVVRAATSAYQAEQDVLGEFLADRCVLSATATVPKGDLYEAYTAWCERNRERALGKRTFSARLKERGIQDEKGTGGLRLWVGIGLLSEEDTRELEALSGTSGVSGANCTMNTQDTPREAANSKFTPLTPLTPLSEAPECGLEVRVLAALGELGKAGYSSLALRLKEDTGAVRKELEGLCREGRVRALPGGYYALPEDGASEEVTP